MTGQQIIDRALRETDTNSVDYVSANEDMNLVYQDLVDRITVVTKGDYFWDTGISDFNVNQSEYLAEKLGISPNDLDIKKINKVFVKYDATQTYYTPVRYQNPGILEYHPDYYKNEQQESNPFFYIQDNSFFIYPAPTETVANGLQIYVIHKPADITTSSSEDDIEIPSQFHKIIADGVKVNIYRGQGKLNEAQLAQQEYEAGIRDMVRFMKQRYNQPQKKTISNLDNFR